MKAKKILGAAGLSLLLFAAGCSSTDSSSSSSTGTDETTTETTDSTTDSTKADTTTDDSTKTDSTADDTAKDSTTTDSTTADSTTSDNTSTDSSTAAGDLTTAASITDSLQQSGYTIKTETDKDDFDNGITPADIVTEYEAENGDMEYTIYEFADADTASKNFDQIETFQKTRISDTVRTTNMITCKYTDDGEAEVIYFGLKDNVIVESDDTGADTLMATWGIE